MFSRITQLLSYLATRTTGELQNVRAKLEAWRHKMFNNFHFLQSDMAFGIINSFSRVFDAVSSEKSCPTSMLFLFTYIEYSGQYNWAHTRGLVAGTCRGDLLRGPVA